MEILQLKIIDFKEIKVNEVSLKLIFNYYRQKRARVEIETHSNNKTIKNTLKHFNIRISKSLSSHRDGRNVQEKSKTNLRLSIKENKSFDLGDT